MQSRLDGDIKDYLHQLKKLEGRRLDYDSKNGKLAKSKKEDKKNELEAEAANARARYDESIQACRDVMQNIVYAKEVRIEIGMGKEGKRREKRRNYTLYIHLYTHSIHSIYTHTHSIYTLFYFHFHFHLHFTFTFTY